MPERTGELTVAGLPKLEGQEVLPEQVEVPVYEIWNHPQSEAIYGETVIITRTELERAQQDENRQDQFLRCRTSNRMLVSVDIDVAQRLLRGDRKYASKAAAVEQQMPIEDPYVETKQRIKERIAQDSVEAMDTIVPANQLDVAHLPYREVADKTIMVRDRVKTVDGVWIAQGSVEYQGTVFEFEARIINDRSIENLVLTFYSGNNPELYYQFDFDHAANHSQASTAKSVTATPESRGLVRQIFGPMTNYIQHLANSYDMAITDKILRDSTSATDRSTWYRITEERRQGYTKVGDDFADKFERVYYPESTKTD